MYNFDNKNETTKFIFKFCRLMFLLTAPDYWFSDIKFSLTRIKRLGYLSRFMDVLLLALVLLECGAFYTQKNLNEKQKGDRNLLTLAHVFQYSFFFNCKHHRATVKQVFFKLAVELKEVHNDLEVEKQMIKKAKLYTFLHGISVAMTVGIYGINAMGEGKTFTTVVTIWPDVHDTRPLAGVARLLLFTIWCMFVVRTMTVYSLLITFNTCLGHQYKNLASYFVTLNHIFDGDGTQDDKEKEYEEACVVGIKCHIVTLWCTERCQRVCNMVFSGQIIVNVTVLVILMLQMARSDRSTANSIQLAATTASLLLTTGFFMWSAGDITVEASQLPTAIYSSGWQHCRTARMRTLLGIAMTRAQKPVMIVCLGTMELSYSFYVSIVKSSYSFFSVLY